MKVAGILNLLWLVGIVACVWYQFVPGLLGIIALFLFDGVLEVKLARKAMTVLAKVWTDPISDADAAEDDKAVRRIMEQIAKEVARTEYRH